MVAGTIDMAGIYCGMAHYGFTPQEVNAMYWPEIMAIIRPQSADKQESEPDMTTEQEAATLAYHEAVCKQVFGERKVL